MRLPFLAGLLCMVLTACFGSDRVHHEQLTGPYYLTAHDLHEAMFLVRQSDPGKGEVVAGPGVMTAGFNSRYLVVAVEPSDFDNPARRGPREYYYINRLINEKGVQGHDGIVGPLSLAVFKQHDEHLGLPDFTWSNDGV